MLGGFLLGVLMKRRNPSSDDYSNEKRNNSFYVVDNDVDAQNDLEILGDLVESNFTPNDCYHRQLTHFAADDDDNSKPEEYNNNDIQPRTSAHSVRLTRAETNDSVSSRMREILDSSVSDLDIARGMPVCPWQFAPNVPDLVADILGQLDFSTDLEQLYRFTDQMQAEFSAGLKHDFTVADGHVEMLSTFISNFATREQPDNGCYIGMELTGLNLKYSLLRRKSDDNLQYQILQRSFKIPRNIVSLDSQRLMDYLVTQLKEFTEQYNVNSENLPLGMVFAMPMQHTGIKDCKILKLPSVFGNTPGVVGQPVNKLFEDAVQRNESVKVDIVAIANDTVSAQMATAFEHNGHCDMAVIVNNDTNAAIMLPLEKIPKLTEEHRDLQQMLINCEWGLYGNEGDLDYMLNQFDHDIGDGSRAFSQIVGAAKQGEYVRLMLRELCGVGALFSACRELALEILDEPDSFPHKWLSEILQDDSNDLTETRCIMEEYGLDACLNVDLLLIRQACLSVSRRSAQLLAAAIVAGVKLCEKSQVIVGVDGTVIRQHPMYYDWLVDMIAKLVPNRQQVIVSLANGSGARGAALLAQAVVNAA